MKKNIKKKSSKAEIITPKKLNQKVKNNKSFLKVGAFTLVEMMAVIVIIAVLSVVAVSTYHGVNESTKQKALDAKIEEMKISAEKWARENNITNRTTISVNTLVVEGYLSADSANADGLSSIINPVTGDNMICNTIDLLFDKGQMKTIYNNNIKNCKLASQSLVDSNIKIKIIDANGVDKTGRGSISNWTNKDVIVIVSSTTYDNKATSISYDFEGSTITKNKENHSRYTGNSFLTRNDADDYYNIFYIDAALLLNSKIIITYDIPGEGTKSRAYTIRIDQEEATALLQNSSTWLTEDSEVNIVLDDGKGSGTKCFYLTDSPTWNASEAKKYETNYKGKLSNISLGKHYVWTEDNAGNLSTTYKLVIDINNIDKETPGCEILFRGTEGLNGWYISNVTPVARNNPVAIVSGVNIGLSRTNTATYSSFAEYQTQTEVQLETITTETTRNGINYYCFVKSLAGKKNNSNRNLKIDKTPPTVTIDTTSDTNYTKLKSIRISVSDALSGLPDDVSIKYRWVRSDGNSSNWFTNEVINRTPGVNGTINLGSAHVPYNLTGIYTLEFDISGIHDFAGNYATNVNNQGQSFGPYYFDNTPPECNVGNIGNQCETNGVTATVTCSDKDSGVANCAGSTSSSSNKSGITASQSYTVTDKAGNTNTCSIDITATNQTRKNICNRGKTCAEAGCASASTCTSSCCGTHDCGYTFCDTWASACAAEGGTFYQNSDATLGHTGCCKVSARCNNTCTSEACCGCDTYNTSTSICGCAEYRQTTWTAANDPCNNNTPNYCYLDYRIVYSSGVSCPGQTSNYGQSR